MFFTLKDLNIPGLQALKSHLAFGFFISSPQADPEKRNLCKAFIKKELPGELERVWGSKVGKERHQFSDISDEIPASG